MHKLCIMNRLDFGDIPEEIEMCGEIGKKCLAMRTPTYKFTHTPIDQHRKLITAQCTNYIN